MNRSIIRLALIGLIVLVFPCRCPAPLVYRPGEGWSYEPLIGGQWQRTRAKDQLETAQQAFDQKNYRLANKAARRVVDRWPYSDFAPLAQYLVGRCYEARKMDERAFKEYQKLIEKYPKAPNFSEVQQRQFGIANRFLGGQWFKLWGYVPSGTSMPKTAAMFEKIVKYGLQSPVAPKAQLNLGIALEKQPDFPKAAQAYETAADRYYVNDQVASDARLKLGLVFEKQARKSEYDQSMANKAIAAFTDFKELFPNDGRLPEAQNKIKAMRAEQALGSYKIGRYYESHRRWTGALVYYNDVLRKDPTSPLCELAKKKIELISHRPDAKPNN